LSEKPLQPHIRVKEVDEVCFISGNPDRVPLIASFLNNSQKVASHRGLVTYKGVTPSKGIPVTVVTTGMGCPSTAIVLEEIWRAGGRIIIRIGSCGSLLSGKHYGIGSIYIPVAAIRDDGASQKIAPLKVPAVASPSVFNALCQAAQDQNIQYDTGLVWTSDIYYSEESDLFRTWVQYGGSCVEMESAYLFVYGRKKGLITGTILTSDGNLNEEDSIYTGSVEEKIKKFEKGVSNTIKCAISAIERL
jgi:uridine phosphorylase